MRFLGSSRVKAVLMGAGLVLFVGGGTGAALCKLELDCHLRSAGPIEDLAHETAGTGGGPMHLPAGFHVSTVVRNLRYPTDFDFFPDGRIVIAEKDGLVLLSKHGRLSRRPFLDLRNRVDTQALRGLVDVTVDPGYPARPYLYVVYAAKGRGKDPDRPTSVRVSRFRIRGNVAVAGSEHIIVGRDGGRSCQSLPVTSDCLPAELDHIGADITFAPDGTLFISTGDGGGFEKVERTAFLAQDADTLGGKILHVDRNGRGLPVNPFWNGDPKANRSKVWALGLRNPFRLAIVPASKEELIVADVGWRRWEELDIVGPGEDFGWPCLEGPEHTLAYRATASCRAFYARPEHVVAPWAEFPHPRAVSITGGVPLTIAHWPRGYRRTYMFGDWGTSRIYTLPLPRGGATHPRPRLFAVDAGGPVAFASRADGLYYLAINLGQLRRIGIAPVGHERNSTNRTNGRRVVS